MDKHHISFEEATTCFHDPHQVAYFDPDHSDDEDRELLVALSERSRLLIVRYTFRDQTIRIISARRATRREASDHARRI